MLAVTAAWGACFVAIDWGLRDAPVLWFAALRALLAGVVLLGVVFIQHRPRPQGRLAWTQIGALAVVNVTIAFAAMFAAAAGLSAGVAGVLSNAQPLLIILPAWWLFGERPRRSTGAAAAVGFIGLAVTASRSFGTSTGAALALLAAAAITIGTLLVRRLDQVDVVVVSAWHFLIGGVGLAILATIREGMPNIQWTPRFVVALAFLAVVGTAGAFVLWFEELRRAPLASVAMWTFLTPVFGLTFSAVFLDQLPGGREVAGIALVLAGLAGGLARPAVRIRTKPIAMPFSGGKNPLDDRTGVGQWEVMVAVPDLETDIGV
jgi:probable blue pigment (indigoidine) exporter